VDELFQGAFDDDKFNNRKVDGYVKVTQMLMSNIGSAAQDVNDLASEGKELQKMTNDAMVMAAITVATAGTGAVFSAAAGAGKMTMVAAYSAELGAGTVLGAGISVAGRASDKSNWVENAGAGALEGFSMAAGSVLAKGVGQIGQLKQIQQVATMAKAGEQLSAEQAALLNTALGRMVRAGCSESVIKAAYYGSRGVDAAMQTTLFTASGAIREKDWSHFSAQNLALGTVWMLAGQGVGHLTKGGAYRRIGIAEEDLRHLTKGAALRALGITEHGIAARAINDTVMAYTNSSMGAMTQAWDQERMRIAQELHLDPDLVTNEMMKGRVSYSNMFQTMNKAGFIGALTAPVLTVATHPLQVGAERALGIKKGPDGQVIRPGEPTTTRPPEATTAPVGNEGALPVLIIGEGGGRQAPAGGEPKTAGATPEAAGGQQTLARTSSESPTEVHTSRTSDLPTRSEHTVITNAQGQVESVVDAKGVQYSVVRDGAGELRRLTSSTGETFERVAGTQHTYKRVKDGVTEAVRNLRVGEDGSIQYVDKRGDTYTRRVDGSVEQLPRSSPTADLSTRPEASVVKNEQGLVERVVDASGAVRRTIEYGTDMAGKPFFKRIVNADGSIMTSSNGTDWQVTPRPGSPASEGVREFRAIVRIDDNGALRITSRDFVRTEFADGTTKIQPPFLVVGHSELDASGRVSRVVDANRNQYTVTRDEAGGLTKLTSSTGETFERMPGTQNTYKRVNDGAAEAVTYLHVNEDGTIQYKDRHGDVYTRRVDGSTARTDRNGRRTVLDVNPFAERAQIERLSMVHTAPSERVRISSAMREFETRAKRLGLDPKEVAKTYHEVSELMRTESQLVPKSERMEIAEQLLRNAARPFDVNQGQHNTCN
ncbi:MAG: RHS repeat protein, partial [Candidatus Melainabacteria bacterium]|nr:RHS repeat protein [Candidatus Melainabacteria bacterium]